MSEEMKNDAASYLNEFEDYPVLSGMGLWKYKNALRVDTLSLALAHMSVCDDLETATNVIRKLHDSYALSSWPGGITKEAK